jgi:hypothetical protein
VFQRHKRDPLPVKLERKPEGELRREARRADPIPFLVGRDLGEVEDVVEVDVAAGELDTAVSVDGEVAEGMGRGEAGQEERADEEHEDEGPLHLSALVATGP